MLLKFVRNVRKGYYAKYLQNFFIKTVETENSWDPNEILWSKYYLDNYWSKESHACKIQHLHNLNQIRIPCIYEAYFAPNDLAEYTKLEPKKEFEKLKLLDVGCGGGICSEALAELNFNVTGIDPNPDMIVIAKEHAKYRNLKLEYYNTTIEDFYTENTNKFDALVISEVLERIPYHKKRKFLEKCISCVKKDGNIFITARNKTFYTMYMLVVFILSNGLEWEHHYWKRGMNLYLLETYLTSLGCSIRNTRGFIYKGHCRGFMLKPHTQGWYFVHAVKNRILI